MLIRDDSDIHFEISSAMIPIEGKIQNYSGRLTRTGKYPNQFEISLECQLSSIKLTGKQLEGLPVDQLMSSVKNSSVSFEGKPIKLKSDGSYVFGGILKARGKNYDVSFPAKVIENGNDIIIQGSVTSDGEALTEQYPVLMMFQVQRATATAKFTFRK